MADNTTLPGTGDVIATDDIGGTKHQLVKVEYGAADSATPVSTTNPLPAVPTFATIVSGTKTVTTAGTAVALKTTTAAKWVTVTASTANTGTIVIGGSDVVATVTLGTRKGVPLAPGDTISLAVPGQDLANIYIDATVNSEGVSFFYLT